MTKVDDVALMVQLKSEAVFINILKENLFGFIFNVGKLQTLDLLLRRLKAEKHR